MGIGFLELSTLSILREATRLIKRRHGTIIDLAELPADDPKTFALIQQGDTDNVFRLEEPELRVYLRRLQPTNLDDLIAVTALYRPCPIENGSAEAYISRKHGREAVVYLHPIHEEILRETHGLILYQEQVMQLLHRIGGIDLADDIGVVRAIAKRKNEIVESRRNQFMDGARQQGIQRDVAARIFDDIYRWTGYSYCKAHAVANACITYQAAYLKAHYPDEFAAAVADQVKYWSNQP